MIPAWGELGAVCRRVWPKKKKGCIDTCDTYTEKRASQVALVVKNLPANAGDVREVRSLGGDAPLEEGMATHSSILAWRIP